MHYIHTENSVVLKRKCREIGQSSPSMMWKRSIVQATTGCTRAAAALALLLAVCASTWRGGGCADLVIEIPGSGGGEAEADGGSYRLDYRPPHGSPAPNFTVPARANTINFVGLPGTKYHFMLYYSNATFADLLTWNQTIITAPEPPTDLTVTLGRNKQASISWSPPEHGEYTGFRFKVIPLTERAEGGARNISVDGAGNWSYVLRDLSPGATYQLHAFTLLHDKESAAYASRNFTTKPNTPGKFIVWFRNETTLLVLWQPPYPPGAYTHYKVSIVPPDARDSELYVEKEGEPPGPAQAAFKGLVPGRAYNISVQTVSEPEISAPTTAQYRTVPLRPRNVTAPLADLQETSFKVTWLPPLEESEFEKYQVSVSGSGGGARRLAPVLRARDDEPAATFDGLEPGAPYTVTVKTMSGKVTSWPATADLTLKPLAVRELHWEHAADGGVELWWAPAPASTQDEYKVSYHEAGPSRDDSNSLTLSDTRVTLRTLLPGRNYSVGVAAVSRGVASAARTAALATRPLAPVLLPARAAAAALRLAWASDVTSRQDRYELRYRRHRAAPDLADYTTLTTTETSAELENLFPGAVYEIQVAAVSYGLYSEWHTLLKPVRPLAARAMNVSRATSNSVLVAWQAPARAQGALGGFVLRYRTSDAPAAPRWTTLPPLPPTTTDAEISNMTHGSHYIIQLDTLSEDPGGDAGAVESGAPLTQEHTVRPNPVNNVEQLVDTRNMTLEWPRPGGRVDWYSLRWWPLEAGGAAGARNLSAPGAARTVRAALAGLEPGTGYKLDIAAHSYNLSSDLFTMETRTRPLIQSEMTIVNEVGTEDDNDTVSTTLKVIYTRTPESASRFDSYRFRLEGARSEPRSVTRAADAPGQAVEFGALVPGRLYNVTMWTVSRNVTSHPVQRQARLFPRPITQLNATEIGARDITLAWDKPAGDYTDFQVQFLTAADQLQTHTTNELGIKVSSLRPHTAYTFTVVVWAGAAGALRAASRAHSAALATSEAPPPAPTHFRATHAAPSELAFSWTLEPADANGELRRFLLDYAPQNDPERITTLEFKPDARSGSVRGLVPGAAYVFSVRAETGAGAGPAARLRTRLDIGAPPRPPAHATPHEVRRSSSTVAVRFRADYFSPANGNVTAYTLVLAETPRNDTPARLPSWRDVHALDAWPPYQVTEPYYPFHSSPVEEFTIGSERCDAGGRAYCNGPLKPGTKYYVKLRAFTAPDKFTDTAYTVVYTEVDNTAWIVGACVGMAAAAGGAAALAALRRRRRSAAPAAPSAPPQRTQRPVRVADFIDHYRLMSADSDFSAAPAAPSAPPQRTQRPVRVADFIDHYRLMSADSDFRYPTVYIPTVISVPWPRCAGAAAAPRPPRPARRRSARSAPCASPTSSTTTASCRPTPTSGTPLSIFLPLYLYPGRAAPAPPQRRARRAQRAAAAHAAPRARRRLHRPLPPHVGRLRLQVPHCLYSYRYICTLAALRRRRRSAAPAAPSAPPQRTQRPVRVADFIDHYRLMSADSDFRFSEEFEELKHVGREQPCSAADLPVNRPKNRFTNILPYDHSRYKLQPVDDEEGSDYINANYVPGHNSPREFIVTQGPLHCTRDDFWRMCWESGSRAIVMLTRCVEKGREKCDRYWPYDTRPVYYGDIAVTALNESRYPDWTVTELMLCRGAEQRVLKHFHFTTWPDFGVPDPPTTLARFVRAFRERCPPDSRPVVVHCSAGVGRSGTFITLDTALQQLANHAEFIDIFGMVHAMRRERVWMVQTEQQYICIHQCLVAVLEGQDMAVPPHNNHNHHLNAAFEDDEGIAESGM